MGERVVRVSDEQAELIVNSVTAELDFMIYEAYELYDALDDYIDGFGGYGVRIEGLLETLKVVSPDTYIEYRDEYLAKIEEKLEDGEKLGENVLDYYNREKITTKSDEITAISKDIKENIKSNKNKQAGRD